ncbi:MAG: FG-GAP-like repeat-containing protein [bacterium]
MKLQSILQFFVLFALFCSPLLAQEVPWFRDDSVLNPSGLMLQGATDWALGDLDQDQNVDILVRKDGGTSTSRLVAFKGNPLLGPPYWMEAPELLAGLSEGGETNGLVLVDLDGDGQLNIVTGWFAKGTLNRWQLLYWRQNEAGDWFADSTLFAEVDLSALSIWQDPTFGDVDLDGDLDLVVLVSDFYTEFRFQYFENVGNAQQPVWQEDTTRVEPIKPFAAGFTVAAPVLMDVNRDTLLDIVVVDEVEYYLSLGYFPGFRDSAGIRISGEVQLLHTDEHDFGVRKLVVYDINDDGLGDLFELEQHGTGRLSVANRDSDYFFNPDYFRLGPIGTQVLSSGIPIDRDHDGALDLLAIGISYQTEVFQIFHPYQMGDLSGMKLWRNTHWFPLRPPFAGVQFKGQFVDLDLNGFIEFVKANARVFKPIGPDLKAFENPAPDLQGTWSERGDLMTPFQKGNTDTIYFDPSFADLDNDGDADLLIVEKVFTSQNSGVVRYRFFENELTAGVVSWQERPDWLSGLADTVYHASIFEDLDRDGDPDLIFGTKTGTVEYFENAGNPGQPIWHFVAGIFQGVDVDSLATPVFADFDGDGRADLFVGSQDGELRYYKNQSTVDVPDRNLEGAESFQLLQNFPNPFNAGTTITYTLPKAGFVTFSVYNLRGQRVAKLVQTRQPAGEYLVRWNGRDRAGNTLPSGVYLYRLEVNRRATGTGDRFIQTKKMILLQ